MLEGIYIEQKNEPYVQSRSDVLINGQALPNPSYPIYKVQSDNFLNRFQETLQEELSKDGLLIVQIDQPLNNTQFLSLGNLLGNPIPEYSSDPHLAPYIENEVILNLRSDYSNTTNTSLQPFATNYLSFHTESSRRRFNDQPRYIVLMCLEPGSSSTFSKTVLLPMKTIEKRLSHEQIEILSRTIYRNNDRETTFLRIEGNRAIFSFRDFCDTPLEWTYLGNDQNAEKINETITYLLSCLYITDKVSGVNWKKGLLVIIDNTFFFHAKTSSHTPGLSGNRHLKRLRVKAR